MEQSSSQRKTVEHQFDSFCKKVLREEHRDIMRGLKRKGNNEILFCEMTQEQMDELVTMDKYKTDLNKFTVCGFEVEIESDLLAEALSTLPEKSLNIILLSYFLDMSDVKIANVLDVARSTVQLQRSTSLNKLKKYMGGKTDAEE
jgi:RNA polymerase sigma factor (sigma-70 family)